MKKLIWSLLVIGIFGLVSCERFEREELEQELREADIVDGEFGEEEDCISFVFPFSVELPDGSILEIENEEAFEQVYADLDEGDEEPELLFPINIIFEGEQLNVEEEELEELRESCGEDYHWDEENDCYAFVYPISFTMPDGTLLEIVDEDSWGALEAWYEENEDADEEPVIIYPIELVFEDGEFMTIASEEDMEEAYDMCESYEEEEEEYDQCFEFVYPIELIMPDGTSFVLEEEEDWESVEDWYEANDVDEEPEFVFPFEILFDDDELMTVNNLEDLEEAFESCEEHCEGEYDFDEFCFEFVFPISIEMADGCTHTIDSLEDLEEVIEEWMEEHDEDEVDFELVYPLEIVFEDGSSEELDDEESLEAAIEECEE